MSYRPCIDCGDLITHGSRCPNCAPPTGSTRAYRRTRTKILTPSARCYICDAPATQADHVIPRHHGGTDDPGNLKPICWPCNRRKGSTKPPGPPRGAF